MTGFTTRTISHTDDLPGGYVLLIGELLTPWRVSLDEMLAGAGLSREQLEKPSARVPLTTANELLERAIALSGEPAIGLLAGFQMKVSHHGYIGFAAMTAKNVGDALRIAERFAPLRTTAVDLQLMVEGDVASLTLVFDTDLEPLLQTALLAVCVGLVQMGSAITGKVLVGRGELAFAKPDYLDRFLPLMGSNTVLFDQPANRLVFPAEVLQWPLVMADPIASRLALEQCERDLAALGEHAQLAGRVRRLIETAQGRFPSQEEVAAQLNVSPRTLKRQLAQHGASYSALLDDVRRQKAFLLLANRALMVEQVADRLGYSDIANFTRAFRRWTGMTPTAWRDQ